jgi:hypothetical protein
MGLPLRAGFAFRTVVPAKAVTLRLLAGKPRFYVALGECEWSYA